MVQMAIWLILINFLLLLVIGLIRQDNPFEVWLLGVVIAANLVAFVVAAVLTHNNPLNALTGLATNALPILVPVCGLVVLLFMMTSKPRSRRLRHYRPRS